jgi:hypothetical protein
MQRRNESRKLQEKKIKEEKRSGSCEEEKRCTREGTWRENENGQNEGMESWDSEKGGEE